MTVKELIADIKSPRRKKVIVDTDTYNEIDDQYAVAYSLCQPERIEVLSFNAAPFNNENSINFEDGMLKSCAELRMLMNILDRSIPVYPGARHTISENKNREPVDSPAAKNIIDTAMASDETIYLLCMGAITNVASALLMKPEIKDKIAVIWLGGHSLEHKSTREFNLIQDYTAGQIVMDSGTALLLEPAFYITAALEIYKDDLEALLGHNRICDYLYAITYRTYEKERLARKDDFTLDKWVRVIWDIAAVAALAIPESVKIADIPAPIFSDNFTYKYDGSRHHIAYLEKIHRDIVIKDCWSKITNMI